jgi:hypothetical protein
MKTGMKLLNIEMLETRISLNIQDITSITLPTKGMMKWPSSNRQSVVMPID